MAICDAGHSPVRKSEGRLMDTCKQLLSFYGDLGKGAEVLPTTIRQS